MEDPKQFNLQTAEKKLKQKVSGKDLNERGGGITPIQITNSDSSSKSSVVNNNIVNGGGNGGNGNGSVGPIEQSQNHIQSKYGTGSP